MYVTPEQFTASGKAGVEAILGVASAQFAALERLNTLHFEAAKTAFEDSVGYARALLGAKDLQEAVNLGSAAAQPAFEKALAYSRSVYETSTKANGEISRLLEAQTAEFTKSVNSMIEKFAKGAPAGSDAAVAAVKSALAAANSAYDSFNKVAKQATEIAEANFAAAAAASRPMRKAA
ncbi:MAG: phasin family protein [Burkholderiales bacterium]|nr:phasin family protein [Burkholderiales bacterium]